MDRTMVLGVQGSSVSRTLSLCRIIARMYHTQHAVATPDATSGKRVFLPLSRTVTDA